jgi:vitamin B12 transporter
MKKTIKISLITVAFLSPLYAQDTIELPSVEVYASQGTNINQKDVTDSVTVITKEDLEESKVTNLSEALNKLGNIAMTQSGGVGQTSSLFLRGMDASRTLILIDGVRYNDPTTVGAVAQFEQIMLYNVDQIEIIKGAQSGVWGADATAGVINIVTSKAKKGLHVSANVEYGSFDTTKTSLLTSYATDKYDFTLGGLIYNTDGFSAYEPKKGTLNYGKRYDELGLEKDSYNNQSFNLKAGFNITQEDRVEASLQSTNSLVNFDNFGADSSIPYTYLENRFYTASYLHKDSINDLKISYNLSTFNRHTLYSFGTSDFVGSVNEVKIDDKINYLKDSFIRLGASYQQFGENDSSIHKSFDAKSAFVTNYNKLHLLEKRDTIFTGSLRYDKYSAFDDSLTGKIGVKQFIDKDLYISANVGTGYNAPTLGQLYGPWGANPNLQPEKSTTSDITLGNDTLWITGFYNEIKDLISYTTGYVQTSGIAKFKGIELGYKDYFFDSLSVNAMYTYLDAKNASDVALARRPKSQIDAGVTYYILSNWDMGINAQYIGKRYDSADNKGAMTGDYLIANFVTNFKINKYTSFYGKIDNISDKYYQTVDGYATAGRSLYLGFNINY